MSESCLTSQGIVVLVHGFNKTARDMRYLNNELSALGWTCVAVNLPTLFGDMDACVSALHQQIQAIVEDDSYQARLKLPVHFVCHSIGGLITRQFINRYWQLDAEAVNIAVTQPPAGRLFKIGHCVFIATPHRGSRLADYAVRIPGYRRVFKPINALLPDAGYQQLPAQRGFQLGLIAGNKSRGLLSNVLAKPNDGHVEVASVRADDANAFIELPYDHKKIHHQRQTLVLTQTFLVAGKFP